MTDKEKLILTRCRDLIAVKQLIYDKFGLRISDLKENIDGKEYGACSYMLDDIKIQQRTSKITPKKTGQFVAIWKRNSSGITEPLNDADDFDFIIITTRAGDNFGQFIFPKSVLADKGVITRNEKIGKRGIRVYPPWSVVTSKQALNTKKWQTNYFITIKKDNLIDFKFVEKTVMSKATK